MGMPFYLKPVSLALAVSLGLSACNDDTAVTTASLPAFKVALQYVSTFATAGAEIVAYDKASKRMFITDAGSNTLHVVNIADPAAPVLVSAINLAAYGTGINSVDIKDGKVAVAVENKIDTAFDADTTADEHQRGKVVVFNAATLAEIRQYEVGFLPDMLTFTPDGKRILVANEGEPNQAYTYDPVGSVSVIGLAGNTVTDIGFSDFNTGGARAAEITSNIRIFGPGASVAQDLEPEYITVSPDSTKAWVTLQENNAIAEIDLTTLSINHISSLRTKDYSQTANAMDLSDRDSSVGNFKTWPNVVGMYLPDGIASYNVNGITYLLTANEGDDREYSGFAEKKRLASVTPLSTALDAEKASDKLGRLNVSDVDGKTAGTLTTAHSYGARSFSIWSTSANLVYDSGNELDKKAVEASNYDDARSDDKGMEPESVVTGSISGQTFAFVGLERGSKSSIAIYDVTSPASPVFNSYHVASNADVSPEGLKFIPAADSPNGKDLLLVANEVSNTTSIYTVNQQ